MSQKTFRLPDLGEGLTESDIATWRVAVGDAVTVNQILAEVETAKAVVEVSSPFEGVVAALHAEEGTTVEVGAPLVTFTVEGAGDDDGDGGRVPTLVGYGAAPDAGKPGRRARRGGSPSTSAEPATEGAARPQPEPALPVVEPQAAAPAPQAPAAVAAPTVTAAEPAPAAQSALAEASAPAAAAGERPRCTPPVRLLARRAGVDLSAIAGSGPGGVITREDVEAALQGGTGAETVGLPQDASVPAAPAAGLVGGPSADGASTGGPSAADAGTVRTLGGRPRVVEVPVRGVRKATASAMVRSAFTAPHVTEFLQVDVTESLELLADLKKDRAFRDVKLTPMTLTARACILAMERTPDVNARWDEERGVILQQNAVNFGFAAATPRGLMVPNVKDAQALDLRGLAEGIAALTDQARAGALTPADLSGGTFTLTNVGVFGVDTGTPIINPGEAAILCLGAVRRTPWEHRGEIALRDVLTLSLSFDHRLVDGEQGSRFLADVGALLRRPGMTLALV